MILTPALLKACLPLCPKPEMWAPLVQTAAEGFGFNKPDRLAMFIAQCGHESRQFGALEENLNYSGEALVKLWPKRFPTMEFAAHYMRKPEQLANYVYANRYGNGDEASGDGWRFRGRGLIMVTFHDNYKAAGDALKIDLLSNPDWLRKPAVAVAAAGWYWASKGLNELSDDLPDDNDEADFYTASKLINGGTNGIMERHELWVRSKKVLCGN